MTIQLLYYLPVFDTLCINQCATRMHAWKNIASHPQITTDYSRFEGVAVEETSSIQQPHSWSNPFLVHVSSVPWLMWRAGVAHDPAAC